MKRSIFCLALAAAIAAQVNISAQATDTDKIEINSGQNHPLTMLSNIDLTDEQKELLSALDNPFAEDFMTCSNDQTRAAEACAETLDRCGGDPRFQSADEVYDMVLQELHQQRTDARVEYLQRLSQILTPEQYELFIKNLDSTARVE